MLPPPPTKPITLPYSLVLAGEKKKIEKNRKRREKREEYAKPRTRRERLNYWKIGLTTMAATQELFSGMPLVL